jgi:hypothetical protein
MNQRSGKILLTNLQPEIKEMLDVMNRVLPDWIFGSRKQFENYLDVIQNNGSGKKTSADIRAEFDEFDSVTHSESASL